MPDKGEWSFDSAYFESGNIKFLSDEGIDGYIPDRDKKKKGNPFDKRHFRYNAHEDHYICPMGRRVSFLSEVFDRERQKRVRVHRGRSALVVKSGGDVPGERMEFGILRHILRKQS